jgi:hypothetical protein
VDVEEEGVAQNNIQAYVLLALAVKRSYKLEKSNLLCLNKKMTACQIQKAVEGAERMPESIKKKKSK